MCYAELRVKDMRFTMSDVKLQESVKQSAQSAKTSGLPRSRPVAATGIPNNTLNFGLLKGKYSLQQITSSIDRSVKHYKAANHNIVKKCAQKYIRKNIAESGLSKFMLSSIQYEHMDFMLSDYVVYDVTDYEESEYITDVFSARIRENQHWFNDLMLYLSGAYTEGQLLNADFFKVIQNNRARQMFIDNAKRISFLSEYKTKCAQQKVNETKAMVETAANQNIHQIQK